MTILLEFKEKLKIFYGKFDIYILPLLKFLLAFVAFSSINSNIGFMSRLKNPAIILILALLCSFLPVNLMAVIGALLILAHAFALSLEVFAIAAVLILLMLLLYFRITPKYGYLLIITPLAFVCKVPYIIPLAMGFLGTPITAIPIACGTVVYYLTQYMKLNTNILGESETESMQQKIMALIENVINNKEMMLFIVAFALTVTLVYVIRRLAIDYAWQAAMVIGVIVDFLVLLIGDMMLNTSVKLLPLLLGSFVSLGLAVILQFFVFSVDYTRTEYVQFEDDEYYYYVKAVPKVTIAVSDKKVKRINPQKKSQPVRKVSGSTRAAGTKRPVGSGTSSGSTRD